MDTDNTFNYFYQSYKKKKEKLADLYNKYFERENVLFCLSYLNQLELVI